LFVGLNPYLVNEGYVVCTFDGRGTGFQGEKYMKQVYKNLGAMEANDTIEFGRVLGGKIWTEETQTALWGWSYGGYVALLAAMADRQVYKLAISGAPVTDWTYYDSVYTERYMVTPKENPIGYFNSSCLTQVNNQTKTSVYLIHGTGDDNVHPLNSFQFMNRMQEENIMLDSMFYTDKNHGLIRERGPHAKHLFTSILNRLKKLKSN
jgi:dipeptidyl-peptidase-4